MPNIVLSYEDRDMELLAWELDEMNREDCNNFGSSPTYYRDFVQTAFLQAVHHGMHVERDGVIHELLYLQHQLLTAGQPGLTAVVTNSINRLMKEKEKTQTAIAKADALRKAELEAIEKRRQVNAKDEAVRQKQPKCKSFSKIRMVAQPT